MKEGVRAVWGEGDGLPPGLSGPSILFLKGALEWDVSGRPSEVPRAEWLGLRRRFLPHHVRCCGSEAWGAHDSLCRLTAALNNFALHPGEAGVATARERAGGAGRALEHTSFPTTSLAVPAYADIPRAHSLMPLPAQSACPLAPSKYGTSPQRFLVSGESRTHIRKAACVQEPLAHITRKPSAQ